MNSIFEDFYTDNLYGSFGLVLGSCVLGLAYAFYNYKQVSSINLGQGGLLDNDNVDGSQNEEDLGDEKNKILLELGDKISKGAKVFLIEEYTWCCGGLLLMGIIIYCAVDEFTSFYTTFAFFMGGLTSIASGYISMYIATSSNFKTTYMAKRGLQHGFRTAFQAGLAMGFSLVSIALLVFSVLLVIYYNIQCRDKDPQEICKNEEGIPALNLLMDRLAGFGLGGSTVALFGRVGGGIYTKAADVGADLVGKIEENLAEDSPKNPATIADNVGDNVGDVAGMGADLFGSFAESTCAALVVSASSLYLTGPDYRPPDSQFIAFPEIDNLMYPLNTAAFSMIVCIGCAIYGVWKPVTQNNQIESSLKMQLFISSVLITIVSIGSTFMSFPSHFILAQSQTDAMGGHGYRSTPWYPYLCTIIGLWSGFLIGWQTEYMTSHQYNPVREVVDSCKTGAATNVIYGLALGYLSTIIPVILIAINIFVSIKLLGFYGVSLAALGMLANLPIGLAIDGYGPISDNAGGIAEMAELGEEVRERTDALDAAGNTTAAIGKGFAIGSAALVSLALFGGYITNAKEWTNSKTKQSEKEQGLQSLELSDPIVFASLLLGAMIPYAFSAMTMKSVGQAALEMVEEIRRQIRSEPGILNGTVEPDYQRCIQISTKASIKKMIPPGVLVILTPFVIGLFFGPKAVGGLLPGILVSGVQLAISSANTGGAWDNAKKYIEAGNFVDEQGVVQKKGSNIHKAAVIGDTVGDPLKDTSGPSLNILVKLSAILSLVFATTFCKTGWLVGPFGIGTTVE